MFIGKFGVVGLLIQKGVEALADRLFRSSLEKDFGEAREEDITLPDARSVYRGEAEVLSIYLKRMFSMIDGLKTEHLGRVSQRLPELRIGHPVTYAFQVKDNGSPVELQLILTKQAGRDVEIDFRSSDAVLALVKLAFKES